MMLEVGEDAVWPGVSLCGVVALPVCERHEEGVQDTHYWWGDTWSSARPQGGVRALKVFIQIMGVPLRLLILIVLKQNLLQHMTHS